jgi:hypothetical protein
MRKIHITRLATVAGAAGAIALASIAFASGEKAAPQPVTAAVKAANVEFVNATPAQIARFNASSTQSNAGMRAYVDPETRQLRPATQAELEEAAASQARVAAPSAAKRSAGFAAASSGPVAVKLVNGAKKVALDESYLSYAVATIGPDGKVKAECVEQQPNAAAALRTAAAKAGVDSNEK